VVDQALTPELSNTTTGPAAYAAIGAMQLLAGDAEAAVASAKKGATLNPKAEDPIQLALALMDPKLPDAEGLVLAHLQAGGRTEVRMAYVRKLLEAQRFADANAQVVALNASQPDYADAWLVRGSLAVQDKRADEAQNALTTYVGLQKKTAEPSNERGLSQAYFLLADVAEMNQKPAEAESWLAQITNPQDAIRVNARRASLLAHQGKLAEARALIRATPEAAPEDARAKISAEVQLLRDNKQFVPVYDFLKEQVQKDPTDVDMRYDLAMAAEKLDKIDEMEKLLRQVIAQKPDYHHAYNALGYSLADRKLRLPEARELVKKALEFAPDDPFILDSLGWVEFRSGNLSAALQILKSAYENRQDAEIAAHLGEVLWSLDLHDQAKAIWAKAQQQSPDNDTLLDTVKRLSPL
jgi:tetratricopeptide (TPR) repeat protein